MAEYQLAQLNIARLLAPLESPQLADFVNNLDRINALADSAPGFVWRLQSEDGDATSFRPFGENMLVNMSVWDSVEAFSDYVFRSAHVTFIRRRSEWFETSKEPTTVLWWIQAGSVPDLDTAVDRLQRLKERGPTAEAFDLGHPFPPVETG